MPRRTKPKPEDIWSLWAIIVHSMTVVMRMMAKSRRQDRINSVLARHFTVMKIMSDPNYRRVSQRPDTRSSSTTEMAYYPEKPQLCLHPDNGENLYTVPAGKFMECLYCGTVWKAEKYPVTVSNKSYSGKPGDLISTQVEAIFWNYHGTRKKPGDKIDRASLAASASSSYVLPSSSARPSHRSRQAGHSEASRRSQSLRRARSPSVEPMGIEEVDTSWERPPNPELP